MAIAATATIGASMLSVVLRPMVDNASTVILDRCGIFFNVKREIRNLKNIVLGIQSVIQDAEEKQIEDIRIREWLRQLVDIGYDARDVLDDFLTFSSASIGARRSSSRSVMFNISSPFCFSLSCFHVGSSTSSTVPVALPFRIRYQLASDIRSVRKRLQEMMRQKEIVANLKPVGDGGSESVPTHNTRPETGPFIDNQKYVFVGREEEKEEIMKKLLHCSDNRVHLIPIWGMGGIGKTTLAQSIYNDERVKEEDYPSKNRRWLCVGEKKFNAKEIITKILNDSSTTHDVESLQRKLVEKLKGSKFLIVLDDVWDVDGSEWKILLDPLTNIGKGGVIILTTRRREVFTATNTPVSDTLRPLSNQHSWLIFERCAFIDGKSHSRLDLKRIGEKIVEKLKGLPLALEVVGRSLLNELDASTWTNFLESKEWMLRNNEDDVMPALRWSYNRLPSHLKQCFAYCALFPKNQVYDDKVLVEMWMAHGLIHDIMGGGGGQRRLEDVGAQYFRELVYASLFQYVDNQYVMHDMIHDLALLVSNEEFAISNSSLSSDQMEKVRHITIIPDDDYFEHLSLCKSKRIFTLYTTFISAYTRETVNLDKYVLHEVFKQLKSIRVLVLSSKEITKIPEIISKLKHLRYLDISQTTVKRLPDSLCDLHNLRTLNAPLEAVLPKGIVNMINLRHLRANLTTYRGIAKLRSLQELSCISVCGDGNIRELGNLVELRGELKVKGLENVSNSQDAAQALMGKKTHIDRLTLVFSREMGNTAVVTKVLDALQCPPNVTYLQIIGYNGLTSPDWMKNGKLTANLQTLKLESCSRLNCLPPLGELSYLKHLSLYLLHGVERLGDEFYGEGMNGKMFFPNLESLYFEGMNKWKEWGDVIIKATGVSFFPCLAKLIIFRCPELVSVLPTCNLKDKRLLTNASNFMRSLSTLSVYYCDRLVLLQVDALVSLKYLDIRNCKNLARITSPKEFATAIEELSIEWCNELTEMEFGSLPSLKKLNVFMCNKLISVPRLVKIEDLSVHRCEHLSFLRFNLQGINSLKDLFISVCTKLKLIVEEGSTSSSSSSSSTLVSLPPDFGGCTSVTLKEYRFEQDAQGRVALIPRCSSSTSEILRV